MGSRVKREPDETEAGMIEEYWDPLIESIIEESEDETPAGSASQWRTDRAGHRHARPARSGRYGAVLPDHSRARTDGMGIEGLYELFEQGFPSPASSPLPTVYKPSGVTFGPVSCDPDGPLVAEVVRTTSDPFVGRLSLVRVFSGTLSPDTPLHVSRAPAAVCFASCRRPSQPRQR